MRKFNILIFSILFAACGSKAELEAAQTEIVKAQGTLETQASEISSLQGENEDYEDQVSDLISQIDDLENTKDALETNLTEAEDALSTLETGYEELQSSNSSANREIRDLTAELGELQCDEQIDDMLYDDILTVSTILLAWWARQPSVERVQGTYRDTIWSNTDTKIHSVRYIAANDNQSYVEHFLVFFPEFGWESGVFWLTGQCWLDR